MPYSEVPSENTDLLNAILSDQTYYSEVSSRNAEILKSIANGTTYTAAPQSYIEELLLDLKEKIEDQPTVEALSVTENGTYSETGKAYSPVTVDVPGASTLGTKTITANGTYNASEDSLDGYSQVTVDIDGYTIVDDTTPASIKTLTTAPYPMAACKVGIEAVQNLNGYSKPWAGGAGKNKFNPEDTTAGTTSSTMTQSDGTFTNTATDTKTVFEFYIQQFNGSTYVAQNYLNINSTGRKSLTFTVSSDITALRIKHNGATQDLGFSCPWTTQGTFTMSFDVIGYNPLTVGGLSFNNVMIEAGSTATSYEPYSNICPITGWDAVNLSVCGKNRLPNKYYQVNSTTLALGTETADTFPVYLEANENYVLSFDTNKTAVVLSEKCEDETSATTHTYINGMFNITSRNAGYYSFTLTNSSAITSSDFLNVMLEKGTAKTSYEAYSGTTYTETLATTNYGGYWDAVNGGIGTNRGYVDLGTLTWVKVQDYLFRTDIPSMPLSSELLCSHYKQTTSNIQSVNYGLWNEVFAYSRNNLLLKDIRYTDLTEFTSAMSGVQLVYELANSTTSQTTPRVINTNSGVTNIWADSGKIERAKYLTPLS